MDEPVITYISYLQGAVLFKPAERESANKNAKSVDHPVFGLTTYDDFFRDYLLPNKPCVLLKEYTDHWSSRQSWVDDFGRPNFEFLAKEFGQSTVPVADCNKKVLNSQMKEDMKLHEFLSCWENFGFGEHTGKMLYLKDWHFNRNFPDHHVYSVPPFFASDWLNEDCENKDDDYKFVYMGPKGSWTPFHADVYRSHSWSANICGMKKWYLFPPGHEEYFRDRNGNLAYSIFSSELKNKKVFPNYKNYKKDCIEVIQNPGEIIFVPSGWHHEVYNLEDTISINHNWFNGCNIDLIWNALTKGLAEVEKEISDCSDADTFQQDCQAILKANHGMDYEQFFLLIKSIVKKRMDDLPRAFSCEDFHCAFDIKKCENVLEDMLKHIDEKQLNLDFEEDLEELRIATQFVLE